MALDGAVLHILCREIREKALDSRIDRISQPSRDCLIITLRWRGGSGKLLLSSSAASPRIHFTETSPENPKAAPMFCMLLRKHLGSGRLVGVEQVGMDRIVHLKFETVNELGDLVVVTVAVEIMGRHSNIIVVGPDGRILDAIKRVDQEMSQVRPILPGMAYPLPPQQEKMNLLDHTGAQLARQIREGKDAPLPKAILAAAQGLSPVVCRELAFYACRGLDKAVSQLNEEEWQRLAFGVERLRDRLEGDYTPTAVFARDGSPIDFSFLPLRQYGNAGVNREYPSCCALLDGYYAHRDLVEWMKQKSSDLLRLLANTSDRIARRVETQKLELSQSKDRERLRQYGDILSANLYTLQKGDRKAVLQNFYDPAGATVEIPLDPRLTPSQNAQKYYGEYRKADNAEKKLVELIAQGEAEYAYIDSVFDALSRATTESELTAIRQELTQQGYIRRTAAGNRGRKPEKLAPLQYRSSDGFTILCGRNNLQNDQLTLKDARNYDIWFHTQKIPGSHTVILCQGKEPPNRTLEEAAVIAATNSRAKPGAKVPVDYTIIKNVRKPQGAKTGMVIYDSYQTAYVEPDEERVKALLVK